MTIRNAAVALATAFCLAGCSGEPSASDMKQAVAANPVMAAMAQMGRRDITTLELEKGACAVASGVPGYVCDLRVGYRVGGQNQYGTWGRGRFFKTDGGWQFQDMR